MEDYGVGAASYEAAGREEGLGRLVDAFYGNMDTLVEARTIRAMHGADLSLTNEKLKVFLTAWLGGPNRYRERFGPISIPGFHAAFSIGAPERDAWLLCMQNAVDEQPWAPAFKQYFMRAIAVPAERVRVASLDHHSSR
ncbi:MAG: group II truncated hemoglobin [Polyangia bacterium]